ncbi:hypothetical protein K491DRAFT_245173 [Lophiostoma macrostomum CBS 122681]|uniref:Uncharacterized protein n=1 Tax=Lophiostoma macrostomum CBS 122681 TaxID=1314788 RepID=A0A6A6TFL7_9PLEO|nr:hypothetical protein K491DRAFT_245173 [Lophiostoma macrostomum CBS 122681]
MQAPKGPPYAPQIWQLGGAPEKKVDIPISAVFLALYMGAAAIHMIIFQKNKKRGHKFLFSGVMFGFCMARITTLTLRIATICRPTNVRLAIAASIFVALGVLLIFVINLLWTQRIVRSLHPTIGWHRAFSLFLLSLYALIVFTLIIVIIATIQSFYTLNTNTRRIDRDLQLYASTLLALISFLPLPILAIALLAPHQKSPHADSFGAGRFRTKIIILTTGTFLVCLGACYRCGTSWLAPVPRTHPLPGYFSKAAFYMMDFGVEIFTIYLYALMRVDRRFHVPDGARGAGSYRMAVGVRMGVRRIRRSASASEILCEEGR